MERNKKKHADQEDINASAVNSDEQQSVQDTAADTDNVSVDAAPATDNSAQPAVDWQDKYMRLSAEFDNYRKRTLKEKMELVATGGEQVVGSLLVVLDDIDRALEAVERATDIEAMKEGVTLIHQKLMAVLRSHGLEEIDAVGQSLDTDLHEAVAKCPAGENGPGKIVDVVQKGYKLKDKVARHAKVVVGE